MARLSYSFTAAAVMAIHDFNNRDSSVVPELAELNDCTVYFPNLLLPETKNWAGESLTAVGALWEATARHPDNNIPCAILGPLDDEAVLQVQALSSVWHTPQLNSYVDDDIESDMSKGSTLVSTGLSTPGRALAMVEYLQRKGQERNSLSIWHSGEKKPDDALVQSIMNQGEDKKLQVSLFDAANMLDEAHLRYRLSEMKAIGITTIFISGGEPHGLLQLSHSLEELNMLSSEYVYILSPYLAPPDMLSELYGEQKAESPIDKLLAGALIFDHMDGFLVNGIEDKFLQAWRKQKSTLRMSLNTNLQAVPQEAFNENFFSTSLPMNGASFVYDSIISVGLSSCQQQKENLSFPPKSQSVVRQDETASITFQGASGHVSYDRFGEHLVRSSKDLSVGTYNIRSKEGAVKGTRSYEAILTSFWTENSGWNDLQGVDFVHRDGSSSMPKMVSAATVEYNISNRARALGLTFMSATWLICISAVALLWILKNDVVIRRSQPFYLQVVCAASIVTSTSILTLAWDEGAGWSDKQLDIACAVTPWFFFTGQILTASALFTKLWRVHRVMKFHQRATPTTRLVAQIAISLTITWIVLAAWSAIDPLTWERELVTAVSSEAIGRCRSGSSTAFFLVPLVLLVLFADTFTMIFAWKTTEGVPADFQDNYAVIYIMAIQLQTWVLGAPAAILAGSSISPDAIFAWRVVAISVMSLSGVVVLVAPKLARARTLRSFTKPGIFGTVTGTMTKSGGKPDDLELDDKVAVSTGSFTRIYCEGSTGADRLIPSPCLPARSVCLPPPVSLVEIKDLPPPVSMIEKDDELDIWK